MTTFCLVDRRVQMGLVPRLPKGMLQTKRNGTGRDITGNVSGLVVKGFRGMLARAWGGLAVHNTN